MSWQEFIDAVARTEIEFPHLASACLAQAILESGRETTDLAKLHNNHHGMKWRDEMREFAIPIYYQTDSEPTGGADFCKFARKVDAVRGYWRFLGRSPYNGWRDHTNSPAEFLAFIGPIWCPPGYTDNWKAQHGGLNYHEYIMEKLYPEAVELLKGDNYPELREGNRGEKVKQLQQELNEHNAAGLEVDGIFGSNTKQAVMAVEQRLNLSPDGVADIQVWLRLPYLRPLKRILLDPGHSRSKPGARGASAEVKEEILNEIQATVIKEKLDQNGFVVDIYNPNTDNLTDVGKHAQGYDMFLSLHHNSYGGTGDPYTCAMIDNDKAKSSSKELAALVAKRVATAIGNPLFGGTHGTQGVYQAGLGVLDAAESVCEGPCILVESYFLNSYGNINIATERSKQAAIAIAEAVIEWFS
ncbi:MAG TPA: N-acetylmuramoyl-L-alanine amidase [Kamptonema sp.]|nr:N-acetylmuramoyl-L-alanine amidase [Kamptonema sp.]